ncbi:MAG: HAD family hydrolase [Microbacteriaceae bacterium]
MSAVYPKAVLWDLDGTIIDSEPYWLISEQRLVESFGGEWSEADGLSLVGSGLPNAAAFLQRRGVDLPIEDIVNRMVSEVNEMVEREIPWRPGARELLRSIHDAGIPQVMVTMSYRSSAIVIADALGVFEDLITGDAVTHPKPHPEPYQLGAAAVSAQARECVAMEDSGPGAESAVAAGCATIAVPMHIPLPESPNYTLWHSLVGRDVSHIAEVFEARR